MTIRGEPVEPHATPCAHVAVLLAAGASTRLGQPKQLLTRDGEPLVRVLARALAATQPSRLVIVLGAHAADIAAAIGDVPHHALINPNFADGLSTSLQCAADAIRTLHTQVLIAACDQPALDTAHLERLLAGAHVSPVRAAATVHGHRLGIPAAVSNHSFQNSHTLHGDHGLGAWLSATQGVARVEAPELGFDIDTPQQLAAARERGWVD